ncbi:MAG: hypothetical protein K2I10_06650 [Lachnospiraceae bacterium]|nr:hypothetical protein [Lachnospiraceae bacterium]
MEKKDYKKLTGVIRYFLTNDYMFQAVMQKNENIIRKEVDTVLYHWVQLFKVKRWEEIRMLAEKNEIIDECAYTIAQLSEDDKIRMQYEARLDALAKENGMYSRGKKAGLEAGRKEERKVNAKSLLDVLDIPTIAAKTGLTEEENIKL